MTNARKALEEGTGDGRTWDNDQRQKKRGVERGDDDRERARAVLIH